MRSRSRERRPFSREDVRDQRRDFRGDERSRGRYESRRSRSRSPGRSRSRDRVKPRARDVRLDGTRELREVKRILTSDVAPRRDAERVSVSDKVRDGTTKENRKISYDDYRTSERSRNDDEFKSKRARYDEVSRTDNSNTAAVPATSNGKDKDKNSKSNEDKLESVDKEKQKADEQYDEKDLKEIEQFLAKASGSTNSNTANISDKKDDVAEEGGDEDALLWEDEEEKANREAAEAEERRKRRQEIASKYEPTSPKATKTVPGSSPRQLLSPKQHSVPVVDSETVGTDPAHGGSSISIPTTMHLAKLALGGEQSEDPTGPPANIDQSPLVGSAVAAAAKKVLPPAKKAAEGETAAVGAVVVELDSEGRQLEAERSAVEQEERIERSKTGTGTGGFGGGYGAGGRVEFDMFSSSPSGIEHQFGRKGYIGANGKYGDTGIGGRRALREALLDGEGAHGVLEWEDPHLQSNWDDGEGYYKARIGELVGERFQILGVVGKGVFSTVLKCVDLRAGDGTTNVAVKMIRNNDTMRKAAEKEKSILLSIAEHDPENKKFCVRLLTHLEYRNHVALVFEYQSMNLRETLKKFGKDVGINIGAVRMYGRQLFVALKHLMDLGVVHADIKLDNILCSADLKQVKLCDFGSAFRETDTDNDPTPYLVSRFYRAPEIILGLQYDRAIDLWAVCASLYELFTGHVMFPGRTNNEMLRLMMAVKGRFPNKLVKTHMRSYEVLSLEPHFDPDLRFRQYEADPITGKTILRLMEITNPTRDLAATLRSSKAGADDMKLVTAFTDLLERGLSLDPTKRLTVLEAFRHHFLSNK